MNYELWNVAPFAGKVVSFFAGVHLYLTHCSRKRREIISSIKTTAYLNVRPCSLIEVRRRYRVTCSLNHQSRRKNKDIL
jgi:hypothetical protein